MRAAVAYVKRHADKPPAENTIVLAGFSRGSMGAMKVANLLAEEGYEVDSMLLFDPVPVPGPGEAAWTQARTLPATVKKVHCFIQ